MPEHFHTYDDGHKLAADLSQDIANRLRDAIDKSGKASMAVSGGTTPRTMFQSLSRQDIQWHQVSLTLVDERWVGHDHADANARLVSEHLLQNCAASANWVGLKTEHEVPSAALALLSGILEPLLPFDVVVLGMGEDGHTASFFPDAEDLSKAVAPEQGELLAAIESPTASYPRITLTLPVILAAAQIFVHISGDKKAAVLERAMLSECADKLPISAVFHQDRAPVTVYYNKD